MRVTNNYDDITHCNFSCRRAIQAYFTATSWPRDDIGLKALTVVAVDNLYAFMGHHIGGIDEVLIDGYAPNVVEVSLGDNASVNLGFEHRS